MLFLTRTTLVRETNKNSSIFINFLIIPVTNMTDVQNEKVHTRKYYHLSFFVPSFKFSHIFNLYAEKKAFCIMMCMSFPFSFPSHIYYYYHTYILEQVMCCVSITTRYKKKVKDDMMMF